MFDKTAAAQAILEAASGIPDENEMLATQQLAAYIASTETGVLEDRGRLTGEQVRVVYGEIAAAYRAGFEEGIVNTARDMGRAIKAAGLQV